ncbi:hypothetical protein J1785_03015 [Rahnella sp. SL6]|uniref:hypothetical protein n=1 Tax=Rahnella perminowiae TaxID=2816244 RepID=UPI001C271D18|nr:hypothetical protein [Rahnella perminowiae]MBU9808724.1 hypothetical protein [Rahnella perminowiae]
MRDFSHLNFESYSPQISGPFGLRSPEQRRMLSLFGGDTQADEPEKLSSHSNAHQIAVTRAARNNPILALKLIERGEPAELAIETLAVSARHLSNFTKRKMNTVCSGWECLDTEDRNLEVFTYSTLHQDSNGYSAGFNAALRALDKFVES